MSHVGYAMAGAGLIVAQQRGLCPSELLELRPAQITLPEHQAFGAGSAVMNLGARTGTKCKRAQAVLVHPDKHAASLMLLRVLVHTSPKGRPIMGEINLRHLQTGMKLTTKRLGLLDYTPHSGRAGFASDSFLSGAEFVTTREEGRWLSDSS